LPKDQSCFSEATELYEKIVYQVADAIVAIDEGGVIRLCNPAAERLFGWPSGHLVGKPLDILLPIDIRAGHTRHIKDFATGNVDTRHMGQRNGTIKGLRADGSQIDVWSTILRTNTNAGVMMVAVIRDVTETQTQQRELQHLADTDYLTGVLNRRAFIKRATQSQIREFSSGSTFSVALFDIDDFKQINDRHGHAAGDDVLISFGSILSKKSRSGDIVARWGGEEFIMLFPQTGLEPAKAVAEQICDYVRNFQFSIGNRPESNSVGVTVSCGVASCTFDTSSLQSFISHADVALYEAKSSGKDRVVAYPECLPPSSNHRPY
jgi:diguanylate cyclase (GGDEF)-like protein/PAS domain S-box-containing protein